MSEFNNFKEQTMREIRIWAWIAAVLPITALAGLFFVWLFGTGNLINVAMIIGETTMFSIAVIWWWWALYVIKKVVNHWDLTRADIVDVLFEVKTVKSIVAETKSSNPDK